MDPGTTLLLASAARVLNEGLRAAAECESARALSENMRHITRATCDELLTIRRDCAAAVIEARRHCRGQT